jgi:hypothetical protein
MATPVPRSEIYLGAIPNTPAAPPEDEINLLACPLFGCHGWSKAAKFRFQRKHIVS